VKKDHILEGRRTTITNVIYLTSGNLEDLVWCISRDPVYKQRRDLSGGNKRTIGRPKVNELMN